MERSISKKMTALVLGAVLACLCAMGFLAPQPALANELAPAQLTAQAGGGDNPDVAQPITKFNKTIYGTTKDDGSYCWYKFKTSSKPGVSYTVSLVANGSNGLGAHCKDSSFQQIDSGFGPTAGNGSTCDAEFSSGQTYYIVIRARDGKSGVAASYALTVKQIVEKPQAPIIKNVKAGKKSLKVSYYKTQFGSKYQIAVKKAGGTWKKYNNGKKLSKTIKGLQKGKRYYVKVKAFRHFGKKWIGGAWSPAQSVKVKR